MKKIQPDNKNPLDSLIAFSEKSFQFARSRNGVGILVQYAKTPKEGKNDLIKLYNESIDRYNEELLPLINQVPKLIFDYKKDKIPDLENLMRD